MVWIAWNSSECLIRASSLELVCSVLFVRLGWLDRGGLFKFVQVRSFGLVSWFDLVYADLFGFVDHSCLVLDSLDWLVRVGRL